MMAVDVEDQVKDQPATGGGDVRVLILGAGPAGVYAAARLASADKATVNVLERADRVGGNSSSFNIDGVQCDYGSHRLHPASDPEILQRIKDTVGEDLLWRPRHGRILLKGKWIHFPLKPVDLLLRLPKSFAISLLFDMATKPFRKLKGPENFASILLKELGPAMCKGFYFPYMTKLWAKPPEELAVTLARRRISGSSITKIIGKVLGQIPGLKKPTTGGFYYPRKGFGQICEALQTKAEAADANFKLGASVTGLEQVDGRIAAVTYEQDGVQHREEAGIVWSTLPITLLAQKMSPPAPDAVIAASKAIAYRGMILIYLILEQDQFTEYDAHYFPELSVPISRLSEPKNYSATSNPPGLTVLCAELPCDPHEPLWSLDNDALGAKLVQWLGSVGLPVKARVIRTETRRLGQAYPVYDRNFESNLAIVENWVESIDGLLTFGRQGLFAHDNTHHAMAMAEGAVDCLKPDGSFDAAKWAQYRAAFEHHVVED